MYFGCAHDSRQTQYIQNGHPLHMLVNPIPRYFYARRYRRFPQCALCVLARAVPRAQMASQTNVLAQSRRPLRERL
jgi:hypothetical protein